jgi:hypothetical protein
MSDDNPFRKDMLSDAFDHHPLAGEIKKVAANHEIDLTDVKALSTVLEIIQGAEHSDPRLVLFCALLLERLLHHKEEISIRQLMDASDPNTSQEDQD